MEKNREITVKGVGKFTAAADWIVIKLDIALLNKDYQAGYAEFERRISKLQEAITEVGFKKSDLKTTRFYVSTEYKSVKKSGTYVDEFVGYQFSTDLRLEFDFDSKRLGEAVLAIVKSDSMPKIRFNFKVKDEELVKKNLLANVAKDAKQKAEILCSAMDVKLGKLLTVNYSWDEINFYSTTSYTRDVDKSCVCESLSSVDFTPDDISLEDEACFIWSIEE